jgi:hypothetical protein
MSPTRSLSRTVESTSCALMPTSSAAVNSGSGRGGTRSTSAPTTSRRRSPCQPSATNGAGIDAHVAGSSAATGPRKSASGDRHASGSTPGSIGSAADRQCWRRPSGRSMFSKTGPCASGASEISTPAARRTSSSLAAAASTSTPISARTCSPSRARVNDAYATAPPRRQPRASAVVRSRDAAPTTSTVRGSRRLFRGSRGSRAPSRRSPLTRGRNGGRVYPAGPLPKHPEPCFVFL